MPVPASSSIRNSLWRRLSGFVSSLAGRLLALTVATVLAGEVLLFAPALAAFHENWLRERINLAQVAALAIEGATNPIADNLEDELLTNAEVMRAALQREEERVLILESPQPIPPVDSMPTYDYIRASFGQRFYWAYETAFAPSGRVLRVMARPRFESGEFIEIVLNEGPLKRAMTAFASRFALISSVVLLTAGALVYLALTFLFVRPMHDLTRAIEDFRDRPEDVSIAFPRSPRSDEIGRAQRAAADMAEQVRNALRQRERLAALGAAVARIGHDLRNMLSTAQMVADRLNRSDDPEVQRLAQRLERTVDRAAGLAASTLKYGRADERAPDLQPLEVAPAVEEAVADALVGFDAIETRFDIERDLKVMADPEHLHRILNNLVRNAAQSMTMHDRRDKTLTVRAARMEGRCEIDVIDFGAGVRESLRERLFEPFISAAPEAGGTGLGLAIARELTRAMGGELTLTRTGAEGSTFQIVLPAA